jgi:S1-C subfamily serine protease
MTKIVKTSLIAMLAAQLYGCATPDPGVVLQNSMNAYKQRALPNKAYALASNAQGGWVAGWIFSQSSIEEAREKALAACRERALVQVGMSPCRVIYENNVFVDIVANTPSAPAIPPAPTGPPRTTPPEPKAPEAQLSTGSGTFISGNGNVLTAEHIVRDARRIEIVARDGTRIEAKVVASSRNLDLAILSSDAKPRSFIPLLLTRPIPGTKVFTVVYPVPGVLGQ